MDSVDSRSPLRGFRLLTLRQSEGLTQAELASHLDVSQGFVSQVEKELKPFPDDLAVAAAEQFNVPVAYFRVPRSRTEEGVATYRKSSKATAKDDCRVLAAFGDAARLFEAASERSGYPAADLDSVRDFDVEVTARNVRERLGLDPEEPVLNATRALERLGVGVVPELLEMGDLRPEHTGVSRPSHLVNRPIVATLGALPSAVARLTLMHELGHLIYDRDRTTPIRGVRAAEERRAFAFAGAVLLPRAIIERAVTESLALTGYLRVKAKFGVSVGAIVQRAHSIGVITPQRKRSLFIQLSSQGWRRDEPVDVAAEAPMLVRQAAERGLARSSREVAELIGLRYVDAARWTGLPDEPPRPGGNVVQFQLRKAN